MLKMLNIPVEFALLLWIIVLVTVFFILKSASFCWLGSLVVASIISWILLAFTYPGGPIQRSEDPDDNDDRLFLLITAYTVIITLAYLVTRIPKGIRHRVTV